MMCSECVEDIYSNGIVEWLSTSKGIALAETLRVSHLECQYHRTDSARLYENDLYDHWLPLDKLELYVEIALEMGWDDPVLMLKIINQFIEKKG